MGKGHVTARNLQSSPPVRVFDHRMRAALSRQEAYMIASVTVDYHVTQVVDGTKGIHEMGSRGFLTRLFMDFRITPSRDRGLPLRRMADGEKASRNTSRRSLA
jgi:hypothetical protein